MDSTRLPARGNGQTFLIGKGGEVAGHEPKLEIKMEGIAAGSGIQ